MAIILQKKSLIFDSIEIFIFNYDADLNNAST